MGRKAPTWLRLLRRSSRDYIDRLAGYLAQADKGNTEVTEKGLEREKERAARLAQRVAGQAPVEADASAEGDDDRA